jgi:hypothetical protein
MMMKRFCCAVFSILIAMMLVTMACAVAFAQEETTPLEEQTPQTGEETPSAGNIYLYLEDELSPVEREIAGGNQMVEFAVLELLKGPSEEETAAGYVTYIPPDVKLQYTTVKQDRSEFGINLSSELLSLSGDKDASIKALAQIVKTIQEVSGIENISITLAAETSGASPQDAFEALGVSKKDVDNEIAGLEPSEGGSKTGMVLAIVFGSLGAIVIIVLILYFLRKRGKTEDKPKPDKKKAEKHPGGKKAKK